MITLQEWMEIVGYRISDGSNYCWSCYGPSAYGLDSWNRNGEGSNVSIIFDTQTQVVYEVQAHDYTNNVSYRMIHPDYRKKHKKEAKSRNVDVDEAYDDIKFTDIDDDFEFIVKAQAIAIQAPYDDRVPVDLELDQETIYQLMRLAHEQDITLNQLVEKLLQSFINEEIADAEVANE
jgi:hypothetical protein